MKKLIADYKALLKITEDILSTFKSNGSVNDIRKDERLKTRAHEYRTTIARLEELSNSYIEDIIKDIDSKQQSAAHTSMEEWLSDEHFDVLRKFA